MKVCLRQSVDGLPFGLKFQFFLPLSLAACALAATGGGYTSETGSNTGRYAMATGARTQDRCVGLVWDLFTSRPQQVRSPGRKCQDLNEKITEMSSRSVMITDLDQTDQEEALEERPPTQPKRNRKPLQTLSGNFSRRSRSVEVEQRQQVAPAGRKDRRDRTLNGLLQAKDQQLEQLVQRLSTLHKYNEQFAKENERLRIDSSQLESRLAEAEQQVTDCVRCQQLNQKLGFVLGQNRTLANDVDMLKTLVFRLNVQIESYQDQRRTGEKDSTGSAVAAAACTSDSTGCQPLPTHTLGPLLQAYDESIRDKDSLLAQYNTEFEHFTGELKRALEDNTKLLQSQEQLRRDLGGWREERVCLQAQLGVCRSKAEAQTRKTDLAKEKLVEVMHCYEQRMQTLLLDMDHLQAAYARTKSELAAHKSTAAPNAAAAAPIETEAVHQCKTLLEELKQEHVRERSALQDQLKTSCTRAAALVRSTEKAKHSRDRLKARLRMALQWAQKLEAGQAEMRDTYDAVRRLEVLVKHKESQLRGLHARNIEELNKLRHKLEQKDETIRTLLRGKLERRPAVD
ncbi:protein Cep89 homolog [Drosophila obscura]|uniref:protein Cep89 homolog n=1 Tax=Drosophila obscura TaxID=7282 RepID=UPI001BB11D1B|nr:protein Cep89 homolog [Drosophila obscura]